jgi:hypothetical protein
MGVQIITGGAAGQFGSGLGKGLNEGIDAKQAQVKADAEKQALADEYIAAMKMFIAPQVEALEGQIPAQIEPQGPLPDPGAGPLAAGVQGPPAPPNQGPPAPPNQGPPAPPNQGPPAPPNQGPPAPPNQGPPAPPNQGPPAPPNQGPPAPPNAVPEYMRPQPNPEREQLDAIVQQFARGISSLREPEAIKLATQAASQQLDMLQRQILVKKVNDQLAFAQRTGGFDDAEIQNFLNMGLAIAQGEGDITDLYSAIRELKEEKVKQAVDFARATSFIEDNAKTVVSLAMSSGAESDPTIAGWYTNQAGLLNDKLVYMQEALKYGLDDFDFDAASKEILDIKHAPNPYQEAKFKQQLEQETLRMRNYYNELEDIRSNKYLTEKEKATAIEAAKKAYGSDAPAQPKRPAPTIDPETGEVVNPDPQTQTPTLGALYRAGEGSFGQTVDQVRTTSSRAISSAIEETAKAVGVELPSGFGGKSSKDEFVDATLAVVDALEKSGNGGFAEQFSGTILDSLSLVDREVARLGKASSDPKDKPQEPAPDSAELADLAAFAEEFGLRAPSSTDPKKAFQALQTELLERSAATGKIGPPKELGRLEALRDNYSSVFDFQTGLSAFEVAQ